jgi:predicted DsbA family dithiol-disulfide isomerase
MPDLVPLPADPHAPVVDVWSDVVCPWCAIGKARLQAAAASLAAEGRPVQLRWRAFQLDPSGAQPRSEPVLAALQRKYGVSAAQVAQMVAQVEQAAQGEGLRWQLARTRTASTWDAHRLLSRAGRHGLADRLSDLLFAAHFADALPVDDPGVLAERGRAAGLDGDEVDALLADPEAEAEAVRADLALARRLGIRGVPYFLFQGRLAVSGAQPPDVLLQALRRAAPAPEAPACGPDGCPL